MAALISFWLNVVASLFKSKSRLEAENAALRHQLEWRLKLANPCQGSVIYFDVCRETHGMSGSGR
jgi:hypothetical protein